MDAIYGVFQVPWPNDSILKWSVFFSEPYFAQKLRMPLNTVGSKLLKRTSNILKGILPQLKYTTNRTLSFSSRLPIEPIELPIDISLRLQKDPATTIDHKEGRTTDLGPL